MSADHFTVDQACLLSIADALPALMEEAAPAAGDEGVVVMEEEPAAVPAEADDQDADGGGAENDEWFCKTCEDPIHWGEVCWGCKYCELYYVCGNRVCKGMCNEHELKCENKPVAAARKSKTQTGFESPSKKKKQEGSTPNKKKRQPLRQKKASSIV